MNIDDPKSMVSIAVIWLLTLVAIIGVFAGYKDGFVVLLPFNILIYFIFIIWNNTWKQTLLLLLIPCGITLVLRVLSLQYDWILGSYQYGETMSYKIYGVPITTGISWGIHTYYTAAIAQNVTKNLIQSSLLATILTLIVHALFVISAPILDLWTFESEIVPLRYYIVMFCIYNTFPISKICCLIKLQCIYSYFFNSTCFCN